MDFFILNSAYYQGCQIKIFIQSEIIRVKRQKKANLKFLYEATKKQNVHHILFINI